MSYQVSKFEQQHIDKIKTEFVEYIGNYFAEMGINVELAKNRKILEKDIRDMNGKFGLDFHGITLNDFIQKLKKKNVNELAKQNILNIHIFGEETKANKEKRTIGYAINRMQKECEVLEH